MHFLPVIEAKRDGRTLTAQQIQELIAACTAGQIPDYQLAAFLMAVYFRGLDPGETSALTLAMRDSGDVLRFPPDPRPLVDKHSTGGVGDKVSLPLAPLLACLGFRVPMISGRGLGITGGTLDKLDSIPGFKTTLPTERIIQIVQEVGCVICGQTERMVPADKLLYALRDVTGTVPSIPLIVASILSKKLAEGLEALVLDVKFGAAAFMPTSEKARELAKAMVVLGNGCGVNTRALLTSMDTPVGGAVGNWLEVKEAVAMLEGRESPETIRALNPRTAKLLKPSPSPPLEQRAGERRAYPAQPRGGSWGGGSRGGKREKEGREEAALSTFDARPSTPPSGPDDLRELVVACAAHLLVQTGKATSLDAASQQAEECLESGRPRRKWNEMLAAQGADSGAFSRKLTLDHTAPVVAEVKAPQSGFVSRSDARIIAEIIRDLGGGRLTKESVINHDVGVDRLAQIGENVAAGSVVARIHAADAAQAAAAVPRLLSAFEFSDQPPRCSPRVEAVII